MTPAYDRELIACMLEELAPDDSSNYSVSAILEQIRLLREANNAEAESVGTVAASEDVPSRSRLRRIAAEKGEPAPRFDASEDGLLRKFADAVEALAFKMPPPNKWTPQFVQLAIEARRLAASGQGVAGWTIQVKRGGPDNELGIWAVDPEGSSIWLAAAPTQEKGNG